MLFFVAVGMLFDWHVVVERPLQVLAVLVVVMLGKSLAAVALVLALRYPLNSALTVSVSLAQIGEFSFILVALGDKLGLMPPEANSLVVAGALISIALNPLLFSLAEPARHWILRRSALARRLEQRDEPLAELPMTTDQRYLARQVVLVGYGAVGRAVAAELARRQVPFVVVDQNRERIETLRTAGTPAVLGDAREPTTLVQAHVAEAGLLVVAASDSTEVRPMSDTARSLNSQIPIVVRAADRDVAALLEGLGVQKVVHPKQAVAQALTGEVLRVMEAAAGEDAAAVRQ